MNAPNRRAALAALAPARPLVAALDASRDPEELAADVIELWSVMEAALRSLAGGSALAGRPLVRDLRQRELISLDQTHALLELLDARERLDRTDYRPSPQDLDAARAAYHSLDAGLSAAPAAATAPAPPPLSEPAAGVEPAQPAEPEPVRRPPGARRFLPWIIAAVAAVALVVVALVVVLRRGEPADVRQGIAAYRAGDFVGAQAAFTEAARAHPDNVTAHVYLARLARERHDWAAAAQELQVAARADTASALVHRELGAFFLARGQDLLATGRPDLAQQQFDASRRYYVDAVRLDPTDASAQGYLGCALIKVGRPAEGMQWIQRAGPGGWSACVPPPAPPPGP